MKKSFPGLLLLAFLLSCGGESGNSDAFEREEEELPEPEVIQKVYRADLRPVNPSHEDDVEGQVIIRLEDETFEVNVAARNIGSGEHRQAIRTGKNCPVSANDVNGDGIIELREAESVSGAVFIPLDSDLENIRGDNLEYPDGGFLRAYAYREDAPREQLVRELGAESRLNFGDRVILILGADGNEELPVACGELTQVIGPST